MDISIINIFDRMDIDHERIVLLANENCNLWPYILFNNETESDAKRFSFIFPNEDIEKGDYITIYSKKGKPNIQKVINGKKNYIYYWESEQSIWNNNRKALLVKTKEYEFFNL